MTTPGKPVFGAGVLRYPQVMSPNFDLANPSASPANSWALLQSGLAYLFGVILSGGTITGPDYIINTTGWFFYSSAPAAGNLVKSITNETLAPFNDGFGNPVIPGDTSYDPGISAVNVKGNGGITYYFWSGSAWGGAIQINGTRNGAGGGAIVTGWASSHEVVVAPSGDTSGVDDASNINGFLSLGWAVRLLPGNYYIDTPIVLPSHVPLTGVANGRSSLMGSIINLASGFTGTAALMPVTGSSLTTATDGYLAEGFVLNGSAVTASTVHGIYCAGLAHSVELRHIEVTGFSGDGLHTTVGSGVWSYSWRLIDVESSRNTGYGFFTYNMTDTDWLYCRAVFNGLDGFASDPSTAPGANSQWIGCKAEENRNGWSLQGNTSAFAHLLSGCSTQFNDQNGVLVAASSAVSGLVQITGCRFWEDGVNGGAGGGGCAGIAVSGIAGSGGLMISGTSVLTTNISTPITPEYGLSLTNCGGHARVAGSLLIGATASYNNGGGNTSVVIDTTTGQATGGLASLTWSVP